MLHTQKKILGVFIEKKSCEIVISMNIPNNRDMSHEETQDIFSGRCDQSERSSSHDEQLRKLVPLEKTA